MNAEQMEQDFPPLPEPFGEMKVQEGWGRQYGYSLKQMREYVLADRKARAQLTASEASRTAEKGKQ